MTSGRVVGRHHSAFVAPALVTGQTAERLREFITAQTCPWCARGPFKNLGLHTARMHDITADQLRVMAELPASAPTCSDDTSSLARTAARRTNAVERVQGKATDASRRKAARRAKESWNRVNRKRNQDIERQWRAGQPLGVIADAHDLVVSSVSRLLRDMGYEVDGHKRGVLLRDQDAARARAIEVQRAQRARDRAEFLAAWDRLGSVEGLAAEYGITPKSAAGRLKKYGIELPDRRPAAQARRMKERRRRLSDRDQVFIHAITPEGCIADGAQALGVSSQSAERRMKRLVEGGWVVKAQERYGRAPAIYRPVPEATAADGT